MAYSEPSALPVGARPVRRGPSTKRATPTVRPVHQARETPIAPARLPGRPPR